MPPNKRRHDGVQHDIWGANKTILKRLYLQENRTLPEVKEVMERDHGFPTTPLSTYESKLRDMGLRKKMKRKDWYSVYQRYLDSGGRHTAIYFNGMRIPWAKAWKEIRRSGAREANTGQEIRLPVGVIMRTPSPALVDQIKDSIRRIPVPWELGNISLENLCPSATIHRLNLHNIPSNLLRMNMFGSLQKFLADLQLGNDFHTSHDDVLFKSANPNAEHRLFHQASDQATIGLDIDRLSSALFRLANNHSRWTRRAVPLDESLEVLLKLTPEHILLRVLESSSPTTQAAVDQLMLSFSDLGREEDLNNLIQTIRRLHPEWISQDRYLQLSQKLLCTDSYIHLLHRLHGPGSGLSREQYEDNLISAAHRYINNRDFESARPLIKYVFKPNARPSQRIRDLANSTLNYFLREFTYNKTPNPRIPTLHDIVDCLTQAGGNVDQPFSSTVNCAAWDSRMILDEVYYANPGICFHLIRYSAKCKTQLTLSGIYHSARGGIDSLRAYTRSRTLRNPDDRISWVNQVLKRELRVYRTREVNLMVVYTLLTYNVELLGHHSLINASEILYLVLEATRREATCSTVHIIVRILFEKGAKVDAKIMTAAVSRVGTASLQLLLAYNGNFKSQGGQALSEAIKRDNYDAVDWLLNMGVDINDTARPFERGEKYDYVASFFPSQTIIACALEPPDANRHQPFLRPMTCQMLQYLISRNLKLVASPGNRGSQRLLFKVIWNGTHGCIVGWVKNEDGTIVRAETEDYADILEETAGNTRLLLNSGQLINDASSTDPCPLEACFGRIMIGEPCPEKPGMTRLLNLLLDHKIPVRHSGVLALLIFRGAPRYEIQRLLNSDIDLNTYSGRRLKGERLRVQYTPLQAAASIGSWELVRLLIEKGADVNRPAKGASGRTALQAACDSQEPGNPGVDIGLIKYLIDIGADVNAPPARHSGATALQLAAMQGDFEIALLLLENGAKINAPPAVYHGLCALDGAASYGRLDMVQFLLNSGALSDERGESGYRGAIRCAEESDVRAIVDMITRHALANGKSGEELIVGVCESLELTESSDSDAGDTDEGSDAESDNSIHQERLRRDTCSLNSMGTWSTEYNDQAHPLTGGICDPDSEYPVHSEQPPNEFRGELQDEDFGDLFNWEDFLSI